MKNLFYKQARNLGYLLIFSLIILLTLNLKVVGNGDLYDTSFFNDFRRSALTNLAIIFPLLLSYIMWFFVKKRRTLEVVETLLVIITLILNFTLTKKTNMPLVEQQVLIKDITISLFYIIFVAYLITKALSFIFICKLNNDVLVIQENELRKRNITNYIIVIILASLFVLLISITKCMDAFHDSSTIINSFTLYHLLLIISAGVLTAMNILTKKFTINIYIMAGFSALSLVLTLIGFDFIILSQSISNTSSCSIDGLIILSLIIISNIIIVINNLKIMKKYCIIPEDDTFANCKVSDVPSSFDGRLIQLIGLNIVCYFVSLFTLGIAYPATLCWKERWKCKHSIVSGRRLMFNGKGGQLIGKWMLWLLLSVVTLSVYAWFIPIKLEQWKASHTHFEDELIETRNSKFDGKLIQLIGLNMLCVIVTIITLGFAYPSTLCWKERWLWKHREYDGVRFKFDGLGIQLIGKWIGWILLSIITFSIFAWFIPIKIYKWKLTHTHSLLKDEVEIV